MANRNEDEVERVANEMRTERERWKKTHHQSQGKPLDEVLAAAEERGAYFFKERLLRQLKAGFVPTFLIELIEKLDHRSKP